jgi:hypothetical protein
MGLMNSARACDSFAFEERSYYEQLLLTGGFSVMVVFPSEILEERKFDSF